MRIRREGMLFLARKLLLHNITHIEADEQGRAYLEEALFVTRFLSCSSE
jgi:hypothetical protein